MSFLTLRNTLAHTIHRMCCTICRLYVQIDRPMIIALVPMYQYSSLHEEEDASAVRERGPLVRSLVSSESYHPQDDTDGHQNENDQGKGAHHNAKRISVHISLLDVFKAMVEDTLPDLPYCRVVREIKSAECRVWARIGILVVTSDL